MTRLVEIAVVLFALIGHGYLWASFFNHTHRLRLSPRASEALTAAGFACAVVLPLLLAGWFAWDARPTAGIVPAVARAYLGVCCAAGIFVAVRWIGWKALVRPPAVLRGERRRRLDLRAPSTGPSGDGCHHFLVRLPGNEMLQLDVVERAVEVPRLPKSLDGLRIVHLSDFHFSGRIGKAFFKELARAANACRPDLVAITGDLADRSQCIDWVPDTLGRLAARFGVYCVLGNHDLRVDTDRLRRALDACGITSVGARWIEVRLGDERVVVAGNELPWIAPAADFSNAPPPASQGGPVRIALAHTPDQLPWARSNEIDLLLAGHTHGGQIRLPVVGPLLSASRLGVRYCSGVHHLPPTILNVSQGVSAIIPLRYNCPPEIVQLVLQSGWA